MSKEPQPVPEEWQLCPKCNGGGKAANMDNQIPSILDICIVCNGNKIIQRPSLAASEITTLEQTIVDYDKQVLELEGEIERLKLIIAFAHQSGWSGAQTGNYTIMKSWEDFKSKHNL